MTEFIFKDNNGSLEFIGDFDGFYNSCSDPWGQLDSHDSKMKKYYEYSRSSLLEYIKSVEYDVNSITEYGCGLGYVTALISSFVPNSINVEGVDISSVAINRAKVINSETSIKFRSSNLIDDILYYKNKKDLIILNQLLWYLVDDIEIIKNSIYNIINDNKYLIICNAFPRKQRYALEEINGFAGAFNLLSSFSNFKIIESKFYDSNDLQHIDCIFLLRRC